MKTVLVTGCSSGYGLETARRFLAEGWRVIATMRTPRDELFPPSERLRVLPLDVAKPPSIAAALAEAGPLDVLVNNAGIGLASAFEATPMATVREVFETNTFGVMALTQAVIPQMRARGAGTIVNVTTSAALAPFPLVSVYTASKLAIEGFSASLAFELGALGVRVKVVEPGYGPSTKFTANGMARMDGVFPPPYDALAQRVFGTVGEAPSPAVVTVAADVADGVWRAANDTTAQLRFPAGPDAVAAAQAAGRGLMVV